LGAENIGHIAVVTATLSIIRLPAGVGTFTVVNKLVAENHDDLRAQKTVVGTSLWINLFTTLVIGACAWFVLNNTTWVNDPVANRLLSVLVFLLPLMIFTEVFRNALMGQRRMRVVAGIDITLALAAIFVVIPMAYVWSISGWFANQLLIIVLGFALFAWFLRRLLSLNYSRAIAKRVFVIGGFAFLGQLVGALILQFDTLAISNMLGDPALTGIYSTASLLAQQLIVFPGALLTVVFPHCGAESGQSGRSEEAVLGTISKTQRGVNQYFFGDVGNQPMDISTIRERLQFGH
jgi:O-antigen/teichoic acid export membrane protein